MSSDQTDREAGGRSRILFFRSGGERFAVDVLDLEEVVVGMEWTPVPLAPSNRANARSTRAASGVIGGASRDVVMTIRGAGCAG